MMSLKAHVVLLTLLGKSIILRHGCQLALQLIAILQYKLQIVLDLIVITLLVVELLFIVVQSVGQHGHLFILRIFRILQLLLESCGTVFLLPKFDATIVCLAYELCFLFQGLL